MEITFKKVGKECLYDLVKLRIEFIHDLHPEYDRETLEKIRNATTSYFTLLFENNSYIGFLGAHSETEESICSAGLLLYYLPPLNSESPRKIGHVLNFYTRPQYRKNGFGQQLMDFIKVTAKNEGITRLVLNATKMGYELYHKSGFFEPEEKWMVFDVR
jgi:GNAT superfamily N-acetyltransferase